MVRILTGGRDRGKTREIERLYREFGRGDGVISPKCFIDGRFIGYNIRRLSTGEEPPLARIDPFMPGGWDEIYRIGRFSFSGKGIAFADSALGEMMREGISPLFIDEAGLLEISGRGFTRIEKAFSCGAEVYVTVRDRYVEMFIERYRLENFTIVRLHEDGGHSKT
jgi:nucleoside-triphosphatase THEP1